MIYYYVTTEDPLQVISTEILEDVIVLLYQNRAQMINRGQQIELNLDDNYNDELKKQISSYRIRIPLYDVASNQIYLINHENVFTRINNENYRFISPTFYENLLANPDKSDIDKNNIRILSNYDIDVLYDTYTKIFYESYVLTTYITHCKRPSFYPGTDHISPYYKINELYYLAYDWNLTKSYELSQNQVEDLCKKISHYDIPAKTLINHQLYIYDTRAVGLVKHYSLFGSYYINVYLRKYLCCLPNNNTKSFEDVVRNLYLENQIKIMINLIRHAPAFDQSHTVYRFIERDDFLRHLKINDIYQDSAFMSTTRNPFYYKENYVFGYILIKIKLPKNIKGVGLCIEAYSNFPSEEEIVLPPTSRYKLINIIDKDVEDHSAFNLLVKKKYEFEWVGNDYQENSKIRDSDIIIDMPSSIIPETREIDMMEVLRDENIGFTTISDRLAYFRSKYVDNHNNQFISMIGSNKYIFNMESYDSSTVYKKFFYYEVTDGIMITTANPRYGNINIIMEIGPEIHVNYYFKYSVTDPSAVVDLNKPEWMRWLSLFAYAVGSRTVVIHSNYVLQYKKTDTFEEKLAKTKYVYSENVYRYLKHNQKMYEFDEVTANFGYYQLDYLFTYPLYDLIKITDRNELYKIAEISNTTNVKDFYLFIIEKYPRLISLLEDKIDTIFETTNPLRNISYNLDAWQYLYNHNLIPSIPSDKEFIVKKGYFKKLIGDKKIPKFKNRLRNYLLNKKKIDF